MDKINIIKKFFHGDGDSLQKWKDLEFRSPKPHHHNKSETQEFENWKRQSDLIRFRNQSF